MSSSKFSDSDGSLLVGMARRAVTEYLENNRTVSDREFDSRFGFSSGVFVTLNRRGSLRGCIGFPMPVRLSEGLVDAAISAATRDVRFDPVDRKELDEVVFEVTVLTEPEEIVVDDALQYIKNIKVGRDGLVVDNGSASGLLLPQVPAEYGWDELEFLEHTCQKAGLPKDAWKDAPTRVSKFQGVIFKEEAPNGNIVRE